MTLVGIKAYFSQALRVVSWSLPRISGCFRKYSLLCLRIKGNSRAHHAKPITGTQINSCLIKNFKSGILRLKMCCNTRMSTHDWWLLLTMYQLLGSSPSTPCTSQEVRWVSAIQPLLHAIQLSAMANKTGSIHKRMRLNGKTNLMVETNSKMGTQNKMLRVSKPQAIIKTKNEGRKFSIV